MKKSDLQRLDKRLKGISGEKILDVATGRGEFIAMLMPNLGGYERFVAIDSEERAVDFCRKQFKDAPVEALRMNAEKMDFAEGDFDIAGISNSIHHMTRPKKVVDEMIRVLKPGGLIFISEMYRDGEQTPAQKSHIQMHHWCARIDSRMGIPHRLTYTRDRLERFARNLPIDNLEIYEINYTQEAPEEVVEKTVAILDPYHDRIKDHPDYGKLGLEKDRIKKKLYKDGLGSAARLFIIGTKPENG